MIIDFHTHTLLSDGVLLPSELMNRAAAAGYKGIAITDHADSSNIKIVLSQMYAFASSTPGDDPVSFVPGVELTHIPPSAIASLAAEARELGALVVVCHGETVVEPVPKGTNMASIMAGADILAHPGLVTDEECIAAKEHSVLFEITARKGHSLTNGHVAAMAKKHGVGLIINSDAHAPGDLLSEEFMKAVAHGAGLSGDEYKNAKKNAERLLEKSLS